ncbi:PIN domain-containing protein [Halovivax cerinus]|uniref:PIN domain-containing protein n=1 Tax=Halovivax cerinus TaxID=1487865 RepID=A0ABD5NPW0_9EURY|nr:PIN domain-containing protein [Halovivax cerinus]
MYVDTDVVLSVLKDDDWLSSAVDVDAIADPKTSVATCIEVQYAMEGEWGLDRLTTIHDRLDANEITIVPLRIEHLDAGMVLQRAYDRLNQFDAIHLGAAMVLEEPIVSTDTLYPDIVEVDHIDPRELA